MKKGVVITGEGIVCAIGLDKTEVLDSLRVGRRGIGPMKVLGSVHKELPVGEVPLTNEDMRRELGLMDNAECEKLGVKDGSYINRTTLLGMLAVRQALEDAGIQKGVGNLRVVLISGTTVGGMDVTEKHFLWSEECRVKSEEFAAAIPSAEPAGNPKDSSLFTLHSTLAECLKTHSCGSSTRLMAKYFDMFSEYTTISTACSSAANALALGARLIEKGEADVVVAGGTEALSLFHLNGFNSLMILDHEPCRPFDATRAGLNLGEGAAFVVMESEECAARRGVETHGCLTGYGNACDAYHQTASSENGEGAYLAMTEALKMAGLKPEDVDYVNAHGTGTPNNDLSESVALRRVFGEHMPLVSSTKGFTGHTTSASGSIEAVICLLALQHQFVPGNMGWSVPMEDGIVPTMGEDSRQLRNVVCNAFGFGGNDTAIVLGGNEGNEANGPYEPHEPHEPHGSPKVHELSLVEITSEEQLDEIRNYVKPLEARRMGKLMKSSLLASLKALEQAGVENPDAIITATAMGCLENSERLLVQLRDEGETMLKPTYFMQSTHNTISSNIAIRLGCHGYNVTYTQDEDSLEWALRDARQLLESGKCKTVLVGQHDESTPLYRQLMEQLGVRDLPSVYSKAIVLSVNAPDVGDQNKENRGCSDPEPLT